MTHGQMTMRFDPEQGGSYTRLRLVESVPTAAPLQGAAQPIRGLTFWSGRPIRCVLSVGREAACWCEWWTDLLAGMPEDLLELRYDIVRADQDRRDR